MEAPLLGICNYVMNGFKVGNKSVVTFKTTVFDDNLGTLRLANMEPGRNTPRSKFYAIKMRWLRSWLKPRSVELCYIESAKQKADTYSLNP
jgi:hypothetical protein